ncbi:MAG TPA: ion transporter [Gaiellaceae bacterium]|nr:ion transporter [Gaiellaceae bacterium]
MSTSPAATDRGDLRSTTYELFVIGVSILSIVNLAILLVLDFRSEPWVLVSIVEAALTVMFVIDFLLRLTSAEDKVAYIRRGGVFDLLACLPGFRIFRLFRIYRAIHVIRRLGGGRIFGELRAGIASGALYFVIFFGICTLEFVGLLVLWFEEDAPGANITTAGDALWWGYVTATTVGYGDEYPITRGGRIAGLVMLTVGVTVFATLSGFLANTFLSTKAEPTQTTDGDDLEQMLRDAERLNTEQQAVLERLRARVTELEGSS